MAVLKSPKKVKNKKKWVSKFSNKITHSTNKLTLIKLKKYKPLSLLARRLTNQDIQIQTCILFT